MKKTFRSVIWVFATFFVPFFGTLETALAHTTFADFLEQAKGARTLSESLHFLPKEYRENYTLMRESLSLHGASELAPRVISFGLTGETIYTFNGDSSQLNSFAMEIADFDTKTLRLNFHEVIFKAETPLPPELKNASHLGSEQLKKYFDITAGEIQFQNQNVIVSKSNPGKCMVCHGAEVNIDGSRFKIAKYIWGPYRGWKGAYGEFNDIVGSNSDGKDPEEVVASFLKFKNEIRPKHPRYAWLDPGRTEASPYTAYEPFGSQQKVHSISSEPTRFSSNPNLRLTFMVATNYARMLANIVFASRDFRSDVKSNLRQMFCSNHNLHKNFDLFPDIGSLSVYREKSLALKDYWASQDDLIFLESDLEKLVRTHIAYLSRSLISEISLPAYPVEETLKEEEMIDANRESIRFLTEVGKLDLRINHPLKIHSPSPKDLVKAVCNSLR